MKHIIERLGSAILKRDGELSNRRIAVFLLLMNVITSASVSIYIPSMKQMAIDLQTTNEMMQMTIVAHLIGEFFGRALSGPFINFHGVRTITIPALILSTIGHFGCCISASLPFFICMRFTQAVGASVVYIASLSIINDLFNEKEKAGVVGLLELYQPVAWIISPFVGALFGELGNWRLSFFVLMIAQIVGLILFSSCPEKKKRRNIAKFSAKNLVKDYKIVLKNSYFVIYALIPGLFAGGYMIFATSCPFIFVNNSADIALFSAIPLLFYVCGTFVYRYIVRNYSLKLAKKLGVAIYLIFGIYVLYLTVYQTNWNAFYLLSLMCIQCIGSAFLVPVSVLKALESASEAASVGASTVVVFRNIIMSVCISVSAKFSGNIVTIMACVFMTVATILMLVTTRRVIKIRKKKQQKIFNNN
ncbi:MAG: MFS transporter [Alphaproteobacteria bacterium]|nr:MFS transporter [Alphaproteobacteria bacterium]